ncbi:TPA: hypothetical protein DDW35_10830 [Candidatus Sumerlaeota bacterium]|jgi:sensor domain CHASE-containing protein/nitrogen-specific signal transduction histidine kinase|nr:hypothetical protein [Candidatus Sumerlaeota bacterium]
MTLRKKTLLIIASAFFALCLFAFTLASVILRGQADRYETVHIRQNVERILFALDDEADKLASTTSDYAAWDDSYRFVEDANSEYIKSNMAKATFTTNNLNFMVFVNREAKIVYARGFDLEEEKETAVSENLLQQIKPGSPLLRNDVSTSTLEGIYALPEGAVFLAAHPILTSENKGPVHGTLLAGRLLSKVEIGTLERRTRVKFALQPVLEAGPVEGEIPEAPTEKFPADKDNDTDAPAANISSIRVKMLNANTMQGVAVLSDLFGKPAYVLQVNMQRDFHRSFITSLNYFLLCFILTGILIAYLIHLLLEKTVLGRLSRLSKFLKSVRSADTLAERIEMPGTDEIASLAQEVNGMLQQIESNFLIRQTSEEEARLRQHQLLQAEKMASLGTLVSGVAHEINNPNHFILSNVGTLQKTWQDIAPILESYYRENGDFVIGGLRYTEAREHIPAQLQDVHDGSLRIKSIVDELRAYAREQPAALVEEVNINRTVTAAATLLHSQIQKYTERFETHLGKDIPTFHGNAQRIERVVLNLIQNACQALTGHEKSVIVTTEYDFSSGEAVLIVRDEGTGISHDTLERIGTPFFTTKSGGLGLGLSITAEIVHEHGGTLTFESVLDEGTTVTVRFPIIRG